MPRIDWDKVGERFFETGADRGVLYPRPGVGVPWNGLISVSENVSGGETEPLYFDGVKYLDIVANENFEATLEAFSAPPEFASCDGSKQLSPGLFATQQPRTMFGLSYRTRIGNDLDTTDHGYKLHIVYNATAAPAGRTSQTIGSTPMPSTRQWTISAVPVPSLLRKPTAHFVIDSKLADPANLQELEDALYGSDGSEPMILTQTEVLNILAAA